MDKYFEAFPKQVEIKDAKYIVYIDFEPDMFMRGFANLKDAQDELDNLEPDGMIHYAEVKGNRFTGSSE